MGRKPGVQSIPKDVAQKQVLEILSQGSTITDAMLAVGRNEVTFRQWSMQDPDFKIEADKARLAGKGVKSDYDPQIGAAMQAAAATGQQAQNWSQNYYSTVITPMLQQQNSLDGMQRGTGLRR